MSSGSSDVEIRDAWDILPRDRHNGRYDSRHFVRKIRHEIRSEILTTF